MSIEVKIKLQPFGTPDFALADTGISARQEGYKETPKYALSDLDEFALIMLCDRFREDIFKKAGKSDPDIRG